MWRTGGSEKVEEDKPECRRSGSDVGIVIDETSSCNKYLSEGGGIESNKNNKIHFEPSWISSRNSIRRERQKNTLPPPRHCDSTDLPDSPIRTEAIKLVRGLNRGVACHVSLAASLGGSGDGVSLRDELRRARRTAQEAAAAVRATLLPSLLDQRWSDKERVELERLWHLLLCCLDSLEMSMQRSLLLLREFSLADGRSLLIHTGLDAPNSHHISLRSHPSSSSSRSHTPPQLSQKIQMEGVEASQLSKELFELRSQLVELKSSVVISHSDFDECNLGKPRRIETLLSINGTDLLSGNIGGNSVTCSIPSDDSDSIDSELGSQAEAITGAQRRCICWILTIMISAFVIAMLIGVFVALFS